MSVILASSFMYKAADAQVRVNLNVNLGNEPHWRPAVYDRVAYSGYRDAYNVRDYNQRNERIRVVRYEYNDRPERYQRYEEHQNWRSYGDHHGRHDEGRHNDHDRRDRD